MMNDREYEQSLKDIFDECFEENNMSEGIDLDNLFESAYISAEKEIQNAKKQERKLRRKERRKRIKAACIIFFAIMVTLFIFRPEQGYADIFRMMMDNNATNRSVAQDNLIGDEVIKNYNVKYEDLDKELQFHLVTSEYLNENYEILEDVKIIKAYGEVVSIQITYSKLESRDNIVYCAMPQGYKRSVSSIMDIPEEEISVIAEYRDIEYKYYMDKENMKSCVFWNDDNYYYYFDGSISKKEALNIVECIK